MNKVITLNKTRNSSAFVPKNKFFIMNSNNTQYILDYKKKKSKKYYLINNNCVNKSKDKEESKNYPLLRVQSSKINNPISLNNAFKKIIPVKELRTIYSEIGLGRSSSSTFFTELKTNRVVHNKNIEFNGNRKNPNEEGKNDHDNIEGQLLIFRRYSLNLIELISKRSNEKNNHCIKKSKCLEDKKGRINPSLEAFHNFIESNAKKIIKKFNKGEKFVVKKYILKEAKVASFFDDILQNINRKIVIISEKNEILKTDSVVNLILNEIVEKTKNIKEKTPNKIKQRINQRRSIDVYLSADFFNVNENKLHNKNKIILQKVSKNLKEQVLTHELENKKDLKKSKSNSNIYKGPFDIEKKEQVTEKTMIVKVDTKTNSVDEVKQNLDVEKIDPHKLLYLTKEKLKLKETPNLVKEKIEKNYLKSIQEVNVVGNQQHKPGIRKKSLVLKQGSQKRVTNSLATNLNNKSKKKLYTLSECEKSYTINNKRKILEENMDIVVLLSPKNEEMISFISTNNKMSPNKFHENKNPNLNLGENNKIREKSEGSSNSHRSESEEKKISLNEKDIIDSEFINELKVNMPKRVEVDLSGMPQFDIMKLKGKAYRRQALIIEDKNFKDEDQFAYALEKKRKYERDLLITGKEREENHYSKNIISSKPVYGTILDIDEYKKKLEEELDIYRQDYKKHDKYNHLEERLNAFHSCLNDFRCKSSEKRRFIDDKYKVVDIKPKCNSFFIIDVLNQLLL